MLTPTRNIYIMILLQHFFFKNLRYRFDFLKVLNFKLFSKFILGKNFMLKIFLE